MNPLLLQNVAYTVLFGTGRLKITKKCHVRRLHKQLVLVHLRISECELQIAYHLAKKNKTLQTCSGKILFFETKYIKGNQIKKKFV